MIKFGEGVLLETDLLMRKTLFLFTVLISAIVLNACTPRTARVILILADNVI